MDIIAIDVDGDGDGDLVLESSRSFFSLISRSNTTITTNQTTDIKSKHRGNVLGFMTVLWNHPEFWR